MKLTDSIKKFFWRRHADEAAENQPSATPQPLRIEGVKPAPPTPEPDDAELAAQALLEMLASPEQHRNNNIPEYRNNGKQDGKTAQPRDAQYYRALAYRIRAARDDSRRRTLRFVAWAEGQLALPSLPVTGPGSLQLIERELLKRVDIIDLMDDRLKQRWQHALATVTVRLMQADGRVGEERENEE